MRTLYKKLSSVTIVTLHIPVMLTHCSGMLTHPLGGTVNTRAFVGIKIG